MFINHLLSIASLFIKGTQKTPDIVPFMSSDPFYTGLNYNVYAIFINGKSNDAL